MSYELFILRSADLDFGRGITPEAASLGLLEANYTLEVVHSGSLNQFSLTPDIDPLNDRQVNGIIRGPIVSGNTNIPNVVESMSRLVNDRSIVSQSIRDLDPEIFNRLQAIAPNIHVLLDILEGGEAMGWRTAQVRLSTPAYIDSLTSAPNKTVQNALQQLTNEQLFAVFDDPDAPQFPKKRFKRVSEEKQDELLAVHLSRLSEQQRSEAINRYIALNFFKTQASGKDVYMARADIPADLRNYKFSKIEVLPVPDDDITDPVTEHTAYFKINDTSVYGQPVIKWQTDRDVDRTFAVEEPEQAVKSPDQVVYRDSLLGAIVLANLVGLERNIKKESHKKDKDSNDEDKAKEQAIPVYVGYNSIKGHSSPLFVAGLMPYLVLYKEKQLLNSGFIDQIEALYSN